MENGFRWTGYLNMISILLVLTASLPLSATAEIEVSPQVFNFAIADPEAQTNTGTARKSIPIEVPPGRLGVEPDLKIIYNSFKRNSWIGVGWDLDMGAIERSTKRGVNYSSDDYVVIKNGQMSELVSRHSTWGEGYYGRKIESEFSKYYYDSQNDIWEVTNRDGTKYTYGATSKARQSTSTGTFKWLLDRVEDTNGNYMTISYSMDRGQRYLQQIQYTGNTNAGATTSKSVHFDLESREDVIISFKSGAEVKTAKRLTAIRIYSNKDDESWLVRTYKFIYEYEDSAGFSRLKKVDLLGHDESVSLPPLSIDWHSAGTGEFGTTIGQNILPPTIMSKREKAFIADINGDSKTDIVVTSWRFWAIGPPSFEAYFSLSNGDGTFSKAGLFPIRDRGQLINFADVNGDGLSDIIIFYITKSLECYYVYFSNGDGTFDRPIFTRLISTVNLDSNAFWGDINGDGYSDIIFQWGIFLYQRLSNGDGTFSKNAIRFPIRAPHILGFVDVNGDGLADCLGYRNQHGYRFFYVHLSKGDGSFGSEIFSPIPGALHENAIPSLGDVNGDGLVDVVFAHNGFTFFKISEGDGTFRAGSEVFGLAGSDGLHLSDVDGDGADDLFQVIVSSGQAVRVHTNFNRNQGSPYLMTAFTDRTGARNTYTYCHSNKFSNNFLPLVVQALESVSVDDGMGNISKIRYEYSGGYFDPDDRSFRGYSLVRRINPDNSITETNFHQGEFNNGRPYQIDFLEPVGSEALLTRTSFTWEEELLDIGAFVKLSSKKNEFFDAETVCKQEDYTYDSTTGLLTEMISNGTDGPLVRHEFKYRNSDAWAWRISEKTLLGSSDQILRRTYYAHDGGTGNLRFMEKYLLNGDNPVVEYEYDLYGNKTHAYDANGNPPEITLYDAITYTFPVQVTNPLGHVTNYIWDDKFGRKLSETDPNNQTTYYHYDAFGRLDRIGHPDGGEELKVYTDCIDSNCSQALIPRQVLSRTKVQASPDMYVDKYEYFDGLGRKVQTISLGEDNKTVVSKQYYDEMGRTIRTEGPFFSTQIGYPIATPDDSPYMETSYDYRNRPTRTETPLGTSSGQGNIAVTNFTYSGFSTSTTDPDNCKTTEKRDYLDRVIRVSEYNDTEPIHTDYLYNAAGDLKSVINHGSITTTIEYDSLGRKTNMYDPDMGYWQYAYDANGNLTSQIDAKLQTTYFLYDAVNRPIKKTYSTSDPTVTYNYDEISTKNGIGRLYKVENANASTIYKAYDAMGRGQEIERRIAGAPSTSYSTFYSYDLSGKLTGIVYPDNYQVNYTYHAGSSLIDSVVGITDFTEYADIEDYRPDGKIGYIYHGNGTATTYSYGSESTRLLSIETKDSSLIDIQNKDYKYSASGDIVEITDAAGSEPVTYSYSYDKLHRLLSENNTGGVDNFKDAVLEKMYDETAPFHAPKKIVSRGTTYNLAYDSNGNMTTGYDFSDPDNIATRSILYNVDNMPTKISYAKIGANATVDLFYDGENKRVKKTIQGVSTNFYISTNFQIINGVETKYIFAGNLRIAKVTPTEKYYFHKDHLGSSSVVTNGLSGTPVEATLYLPFGMTRDQFGYSKTNYKFTDQELDPQLGLYNYDARLYDTTTVMFIVADAIVPGIFKPKSYDRYSYCNYNPLKYIDPSGHLPGAIELSVSESEGKDWWGGTPYGSGNIRNNFDSSRSQRDTWMISMKNREKRWSIEKTLWNSKGSRRSSRLSGYDWDNESYKSSLRFVSSMSYEKASYSPADILHNSQYWIPDVVSGVDSPLGGLKMIIPFGSGGLITTTQTLPSINAVLGPGVNAKFQLTVDQSEGSTEISASVTTPIGGGKGSIKNSGQQDFDLIGPRINLPLGFGANAYFGLEWE